MAVRKNSKITETNIGGTGRIVAETIISIGFSAAAVFAVFFLGCSGNPGQGQVKMTLTAEPASIPADGRSFSLITASVQGAPDGSSVAFGTSLGSFDPDVADMTQDSRDLAGGIAKVKLYSGSVKGNATVTAVLEEAISKSIQVEFTATPQPDPRNIQFSCQSVNIAGFTTKGAQMECTLVVKDENSNPLPYDALIPLVELKAEAGGFSGPLEQDKDDYESSNYILHYVYKTSLGSRPVDVEPDQVLGEESRNKTGGTANPRDGLVTLLAVVKGREHCDGQIVDNECSGFFDDLPEPFVDVDDDGVYTPGVDKFLYDQDGDQKAGNGNGKWDREWPIGKWVKVLWSGPPKTDNPPVTEISPMHAKIEDCGEAEFSVQVLDENLNPPAANEGGGDLSIDVDGGSLKSGVSSLTLPSTMGMVIDDKTGKVTSFLDLHDSYRIKFFIIDSNCEGADNDGVFEDGSVTVTISSLYKGPYPEFGSDYTPDTFDDVVLKATLSVD
ncbi:MAG: hypothetical protein GXP49_02465 [Deltaproteobacteria bacterium]|nr:hypothetical protein [Deltaproteobacteria bacterium]